MESKTELKSKTIYGIIIILLISTTIMFFIKKCGSFNYLAKSCCKIILFAFIPYIFCYVNKTISLKDYFKIKNKKHLIYSLALGLAIYLIIIFAYLIAKSFINLDDISTTLNNNLMINKSNFIFVALYISFINSLLEEFFFRGFVFLSLNKITSRFFSYVISALSFSLYHFAMILTWFNIYIFIFILLSLFLAGLIFNKLNEKNENIYNSWLVHMFANFAINTIGIVMFYF